MRASGTVAPAGIAVAALAAAVLAVPEIAAATTDTTFDTPLDTVEDIVGGTGGQLAAALAVGEAPKPWGSFDDIAKQELSQATPEHHFFDGGSRDLLLLNGIDPQVFGASFPCR